MKRQHTYEQIIGQKLNGLTPPDVAGLWDNMEAILDREMPQQEKKKRPIAGWLNANLLVAAGLLVTVGSVYTLCRVSGKAPETATVATIATPVVKEAGGEMVSNQANEKTLAGEETVAMPVAEKAQVVAKQHENGHWFQPSAKATAAIASGVIAKGPETNAGIEGTANGTTSIGETTAATPTAETSATSVAIEEAVAAPEEATTPITAALKEATPVQTSVPPLFDQQHVPAKTTIATSAKKKTIYYSDKGFVAGLTASVPAALGAQQKNGLDIQGKKNEWQDLTPGIYAQYHLNRTFYVQAEWQPSASQYTPRFTLYDRTDILNPDEKSQKVVKLNKLFYTNVPVSFHYNTPVKNLTVGLGVQYSKLKRILLQDQEYYHLIGAGGVFNVDEQKNEVVVKDPEAVRGHSSGDVVDSVARSFRREDWRLLADVGYRYKALQLGVRYTTGVRDYINTNFTNLQVKDRNESLQFYLRVNLFDSRKKTF